MWLDERTSAMCYARRAVLLAKEGHPSAAIRCDSVSRHRTRLPATFTGRPHAQAFGDLPQLGTSGREETAQQSAVTELLHPALPALSTTSQPLEDPGQLRRDRILALAKESPGVVDELDVAPQRETLHHAF